MLVHLKIKNYALIKSMEIDLQSGFSVITGETGSGKSILLGALGLVLGNRAESSVLFDKNEKCIIEAIFDLRGLQEMFDSLDLDYQEESVFRREITPKGRSRAFVNDTPVQLTDLREIGNKLVDIHSQHGDQLLSGTGLQIDLLDSFGGHAPLVDQYRIAYGSWQRCKNELKELETFIASEQIDKDYLQFQIDELNEMDLANCQQEEMESQLAVFESAGEIKTALTDASSALSSGTNSVLTRLRQIENSLSRQAQIIKPIEDLLARVKSCRIELDDIQSTIMETDATVEINPEQMSRIQEKLNDLNRLQNKHRVANVQQLQDLLNELESKVDKAESASQQLNDLKERETELNHRLEDFASELRKARKMSITGLEEKISSLFPELAMPNATLEIALEKAPKLLPSGGDEVRFLFSANKGGELLPLSKVASGGELSRLMLILKTIVASKVGLPTLIFDEIDTGVSGKIASRMAEMLCSISDDRQVLAITHLAQVASKADNHFRISKFDDELRSQTVMELLDKDKRVAEIAQMLGGVTTGEASIANALELLGD